MMTVADPFAFVVLQYGGFDITRQCLSSLEVLRPDPEIVVVDNASPDDAGRLLQEYAVGREHVHVIMSETNSGFSHGNNLGYQYARDILGSRYIVVLNNDVEVPQLDFEARVTAIQRETGFAVLGPDIYAPARRYHQNPYHAYGDIFHPDNPTLADLNVLLDYVQSFLAELEEPQRQPSLLARVKHSRALASVHNLCRDASVRRVASEWAKRWTGRFEDVPLQGACYVFGPPFVEAMSRCFVPEPFLYSEEILLQMNCMHWNLKMVYDSSVRVVHHEGSSTERLFDDIRSRQRKRFEFENEYRSVCLCGLYRAWLDEVEGRQEGVPGEREAMSRRAKDAGVSLEGSML